MADILLAEFLNYFIEINFRIFIQMQLKIIHYSNNPQE